MGLGELIGGIGSAIGSIGSGVMGGLSALWNKKQQENLLQFQQSAYSDNLAWQKQQFAINQEREDTAVQRRLADLKAAGLSPTLAAGSAAQTMSAPNPLQPTGMSAPEMVIPKEAYPTSIMSQALGLMQMKKDVEKTDAQVQAQKLQNDWMSNTLKARITQENVDAFVADSLKHFAVNKGQSDAMYARNRAEVQRLNIGKAELQNTYDYVRNYLQQNYDVPKAQMDLVALDVAIKIKKREQAEGEYNYSLYRTAATPTDQSWDVTQKLASQFTHLITNLFTRAAEYEEGVEDRKRSNLPPHQEFNYKK